jgi:hypothetical protein
MDSLKNEKGLVNLSDIGQLVQHNPSQASQFQSMEPPCKRRN